MGGGGYDQPPRGRTEQERRDREAQERADRQRTQEEAFARDELIRAEEEAGNHARRLARELAQNMDAILAMLDAGAGYGQVLDQRTLLARYPADAVNRYSIHQSSPGSSAIPSHNRPMDQIDETPISTENYSQHHVNNGQLDPIRLWFKLGEDIPGDQSNYFRKSTLGVTNYPASFEETFLAESEVPAWLTYEPQGSVNIFWNYPGRKRNRGDGPDYVWDKTNVSSMPQQERDQAVQWALAINHKKFVSADRIYDGDVYALQPPNKAWDINDPNKKDLREQLVIMNRFPQARGNEEGEAQPFNMAKAMIDLSDKAAPWSGQGTSVTTMPTLPQEYIELLQTDAHTKGLRDDGLPDDPEAPNLTRLMLMACESGRQPGILTIDNTRRQTSTTAINFAQDPAAEDNIRRLVIGEHTISFHIPEGDQAIAIRLRGVQCNSYHVYLACRSMILNGYDSRIASAGAPDTEALVALDRVVRDHLGSELEEDSPERNFDNRDPKYVFREALNNFVEYEFFDFATKAAWSMDRFTSMMKKSSGNFPAQAQRDENNRAIAGWRHTNRQAGIMLEQGGGYVNPEYNYYKANYEAACEILPEAVLPNMYIYNLAQGSKGPGLRGKFLDQEYQEDAANFSRLRAGENLGGRQQSIRTVPAGGAGEGEEVGDRYVETMYDKVITLDQFDKFTLPLLGNNNIGGERLSQEERASFEEYLERYAEAAKGSNVTIDFTSRLASDFYNQITPSNELDMYDNFYKNKDYFPMYVEVGIPCYSPLGDLGQLFLSPDDPDTDGEFEGLGLSPTNLINSFVSSSANRLKNFTIQSTGLVASDFESGQWWSSLWEDRTRAERGDDFNPRIVTTKRDNVGLKVYDFDDWIEDMKGHFRHDKILSAPSRQSREELDAILETFQAEAEAIGREKLVKYQDLMITKSKVMCETETIIYKLVKKEGESGEIIQNYFFPNSPTPKLIKFIDTQVKYNKSYLYELYAYDVVYGSSFRFRTRYAAYPDQQQPIPQNGMTVAAFEESYTNVLWQPNSDDDFKPYQDQRIAFSFNVETIPNLKIIEYPIYALQNAMALARATGVQGRPAQQYTAMNIGDMGGVSYPYAKVVDRPPMPPAVSIMPYQGDKNRILINLSTTEGALVGDKTVEFIPLVDGDKWKAGRLAWDLRQVENFTLPPGHLEFRTEGFEEIKKVEIFRTTELDEMASSMGEMYESFKNKLYKTLDITLEPDDPSGNYARSFDLVDNILQNQVYYYTFRMVDVHDHTSNPTAIYRVKIDSEAIGIYPSIEVVNIKNQQARFKKPTKKVTRYLEIKASDIQSMPYIDSGEGDIQTSVRSLVDSDTENRIDNNDFLIRITSTDTGRKIDIKTSFKIKQESD